MAHLVFTSRPLSIKQPISIVNAISRVVEGTFVDHVAILKDGVIYESVAGKGVHSMEYDEWKIGREGTHLFLLEIDDDLVDFNKFKLLKGKKYDYMANLFHLFKMDKRLAVRPLKRIYCSELAAIMLGVPNSYDITPNDLFYLFENDNNLTNDIIDG